MIFSGDPKKPRQPFHNAEALCEYIEHAHEDYLSKKHDVETDIRHILSVNKKALSGMIDVLAEKRSEHMLKHS